MIEDQLKELLEKNINCIYLEVINESHLHAGHAGSPGTGQSHFKINIVSDDFINQSRVERHQMIYGFIGHLFEDGLHAVTFNLKTKKEYDCT